MNISTFVSITDAARPFGLNPHRAKGIAEGLGIELIPGGNALLMTRKDHARFEARVREILKAQVARDRQPEPALAK